MNGGRRRSFWGWGFAERADDDGALAALAARVSLALGGLDEEPRRPPSLDEIALPRPRLEVPPALAAFSSTDAYARAGHCYGKAYRDLVRGLAGDFSSAPDLVVRPRSEDEIERALEECERLNLAVIPYGGGTSVVGGVEAAVGAGYDGAACLDVGALDEVLEIDDVSRAARIQAGATGPVLEAQLASRGMTLRHFPQSFELSTLGGWIATRAGGHFATLYTRIDDLVESTRMITPRGAMTTRRLPSSGAGPAPDRLVLGSEGTLGVITEAWVRVQARPAFRASASVRFSDYDAAVDATRAIAQAGLYPANCRLLDASEALLHDVARDGSAVLLLAFESADHPLDAWIDRAVAIAAAHGGVCKEGKQVGASDDAAGWRKAFLEAPYLQNDLVRLGVLADTFETACTWDRFRALHGAVMERVRDALARECGGGGVVTCRFSHVYPDGPAPYFTFLGRAKRGAELEQWAAIKEAASGAILDGGGTITHHHAVGRTHLEGYRRERPALFERMLDAAKRAVDPRGIMNPGVLLPSPHARAALDA